MSKKQVKEETIQQTPITPSVKQVKDVPVAPPAKPRDPRMKWEEKRLRYNKPIRGLFKFIESPNGTLPLVWHEFYGDPVRRWELKDGEQYTLPLGAVLQLRRTGYYHGDVWVKGLDGKPAKKQGSKTVRYIFEPFDFIADEDYQSAEITPEIIPF